ncbi:MAG TPA: HD domain-containing protein [Firmicutes bacterium]|nr:HD domain-containing protein [Bacillota bacterium]
MQVKDMAEGALVRGHYLITRKELIPFSSKPGRFLLVHLADKTGEIRGIVWNQAEEVAAQIATGDIVAVEGRVTVYRDTLQIVCSSVMKPLPGEYSPEDFLPASRRSRESMLAELMEVIQEVEDRDCRALLEAVFTPDFLQAFTWAPAARSMHQAYVGGLAEHTLNVVRLCQKVAELYPEVDRNLLITGALLHDIGKVYEYKIKAAIEITDVGRLIGHVVIGHDTVTEAIAGIEGFSEEKALRLRHMLLSHHGQLEWGSPKEPQTLEACILHHCDNLDSEVSKFAEVLAAAGQGERWTPYDSRLGRSLFAGNGDFFEPAVEDAASERN